MNGNGARTVKRLVPDFVSSIRISFYFFFKEGKGSDNQCRVGQASCSQSLFPISMATYFALNWSLLRRPFSG
jgi:hypothetical protein